MLGMQVSTTSMAASPLLLVVCFRHGSRVAGEGTSSSSLRKLLEFDVDRHHFDWVGLTLLPIKYSKLLNIGILFSGLIDALLSPERGGSWGDHSIKPKPPCRKSNTELSTTSCSPPASTGATILALQTASTSISGWPITGLV